MISGIGFHGPYPNPEVEVIKNFQIDLQLYSQKVLLNERQKIVRVKFPSVILPIFFARPTKLEPETPYFISMQFTLKLDQNWPPYLLKYPKNEIIHDLIEFSEPNCLHKNHCTLAYIQSGQIRLLYFWPSK